MTEQEAIKILHPDTTATALHGYSKEEAIKLVNEACVIACKAMERCKRIDEEWGKYDRG